MKPSNSIPHRKSGQAIIFLMVVMVIGLFIVLWNFDLHNTVSTKIRVGNAGDAAALSAARWQGVTMNMVGELNLMQAAVLLEDPLGTANVNAARELTEMRSRISLNGPLMGYIAAQAAGFMNLKDKDINRLSSSDSSYLGSRGAEFEASGDGLFRGQVSPPYDGAWGEYGALLSAIAAGDMLVNSANTKYFIFYDGSHTLLNPGFYDAVAAEFWCWFSEGYRYLLAEYSDYGHWPSLPPIDTRPSVNSEYFSTDMKKLNTDLYSAVDLFADGEGLGRFRSYLLNQGSADSESNPYLGAYTDHLTENQLDENYDILVENPPIGYTWHFYNEESWGMGGFMEAYGDQVADDVRIKPEFDYTGGADSAVDVYIEPFGIAPGMQIAYNDIRWPAAAKPFGWLDVSATTGDAEKKIPHYFGMVLPAFRQARLIRNKISSRTEGVHDPRWDEHIYEHLPDYLSGGLEPIRGNGCYYCEQLTTWEDPAFRAAGDTWLQNRHDDRGTQSACYIEPHPGGGPGSGGGGGDWR